MLAVLTGADAEADKIGSLVPIMPEDMGGPKGYRTLRPILSQREGAGGRRPRRLRRGRDAGSRRATPPS